MLRESTRPLRVWCTDEACADLTRGNPIFGVLAHYCGVERRAMRADGSEFTIEGVPGVLWRRSPYPSKPAPFSPHREAPVPGDNVALVIDRRRQRTQLRVRSGTRLDGGDGVAGDARGSVRAGRRHLLAAMTR